MYKKFFNLLSTPFSSSPDPHFLYMMPHIREAAAALEYGIATRRGFIVLTGEVGTGKTTLLRHTLNSFTERRVISSFIFNPRLEVLDFLEFVLNDFGIVPASRNKASMLMQLNRWLLECFALKQTCVIIVDEAQELSWDLLEEIRLLTNLETSSEKLVQIVLSGQPEFEDKLRQPNLRQLRQRVTLWCRTFPLTQEQTAAYIGERLRIAGSMKPLFTANAMSRVYHASRGIPRIINLICENALIFGYVEQVGIIPAGIVDAVVRDLELLPPESHGLSEAVSPEPGQTQASIQSEARVQNSTRALRPVERPVEGKSGSRAQ